jgi:hypothetical protein
MMRRTALIASIVTASLTLGPLPLVASEAEPAQVASTPDFSAVDGHSSTVADVADSASAEVSKPALAATQSRPLDTEMEDVKKALLKLKRDLVILEEDLLFPASSQVSVFLSMDLGEFFQLDSVVLKLNGKEVASHLYTDKQVDALYRGGVQKVFVGNVKQGENTLTAFFTGRGPSGRDYRRATTVDFEKSFEPTFVELAISDSTAKYQPEFRAAVAN